MNRKSTIKKPLPRGDRPGCILYSRKKEAVPSGCPFWMASFFSDSAAANTVTKNNSCCGPTIYATKRASFDDLEPTISAISFKKQTQCKRKGPTIYATRNRRFYICLPLIQAVLSNKIGGFVIRRRTLHSLSRGNP